MFTSKKRAKSAKKVVKEEKKRHGNSVKVSKQKTITSTRMTAGSDAGKSGQRSYQHQLLSTSAQQCTYTETISREVSETSTTHSTSHWNGQISHGGHLMRRTYSLEKVSRSLDEVMASGKAILDALVSVNSKGLHSQKAETSQTNSRSDLRKRGTYDINKVSDLLDSSVDNGTVLEESLNDISQVSSSSSSRERSTYDFDSVSTKLDESIENDTSLEQLLYKLSIDGVQDGSTLDTKQKRGTYDLDKVSTSIDDSLDSGKSIEDSLEQVFSLESDISPKFNSNRRGTYNLSDAPNQLDQSNVIPTTSEKLIKDSTTNTSPDQAVRRRTYNLSDVSDVLDNSINSGKSIDDSLDQISSVELKRRTYDLTNSKLGQLEQQKLENTGDNNNTIRDNKQEQIMDERSLKNPENLSNDVSNHRTESDKRNTYILEDADNLSDGLGGAVVNSENFTENSCHGDTKPLDGLLSELGLDSEDGRLETELTPGQWIEQMKGLMSTQTISPQKFKLSHEKVDSNNSEVKPFKQISEVIPVESKQRSQTISSVSSTSELNYLSDYEVRTRSLSDSKVKSELKSSSTPNFSTSCPSSQNVSGSDSLEDISPDILNYLTNKLGLSEEQCIAVHRRLGCEPETSAGATKLANRKTYSLDDVAHSLDIATSQGLPMTTVLDNLDAMLNESESETRLNNIKDENQNSDANSTIFVEASPKSASGDSNTSSERPETLNLYPTVSPKAPTNQKTYTLNNGSTFIDSSPTRKSPTTSFDSQFKLIRKKALYKPSAKLQSFSYLLGCKDGDAPLRRTRGRTDPLRRNTYTLESVAESLEKAQDAGVPMLDALKRLSGSCQGVPSELPDEKRKTYDLEDVSKTLETAVAAGVPIVDTLRTIADPLSSQDQANDENEIFETTKQQPKKTPPPKPKRTFSNSSKPEIKFVSDSFVIEYFTSPKRSQSASSERDGRAKIKENLYVNAVVNFDAKLASPSASVKDGKEMSTLPMPKPRSTEDQQPATKVVNDLNTLLLKLAAEVEKPKNVVSKADSSLTSTDIVLAQDLDSEILEKDELEIKGELSVACPTTFTRSKAQDSAQVSVTQEKDELELVSVQEPNHTTVTEDRQIEARTSNELASNSMPLNTAEIFCHQSKGVIDASTSPKQVESKTMELCNSGININKLDSAVNKPNNILSDLPGATEIKTCIADLSGKNIDLKKTNYSVNNSDIEPDSLKLVRNEELNFSSAKLDDEGYCSLSRKPSKVKQETQFASVDLFKEENIVSGLEDGSFLTKGNVENKVQIIRSYDNDGESQEVEIKLTAESDTEALQVVDDSDRSDSAPMADSVSRELNLLRLRLAEKQRDIEAQKQLTKEQLEEERKRFGQNVFWLAVCKGRDKKEGSECDSPKKTSTQAGFEQRLPTISTKIGKTSNLDSSTNSKFASFTKHSSLDEELPPSMGKLQDRTFNMKTNNNTLSKNNSIPEEKTTLPNEYFGSKRETNVKHSDDDRNTSVEHWNPTFEDRDMSEDVVQFRLSRQAPRNQSPAISFPGNSENESPKAEKPKTPVLNYKSRINVPVSFHAKPNSENSTAENSQIQISENFTDRQRQGNENFFDMDTKSAGKPPTSPHRKCWDTVKAISDEPCIAASKSSHHLLDQNDGSASKDSQRLGMHSEGGGMGSKDYVRSGSEGLGRSEDDVYMETGGVKQSPDEGEFESGNLNSSPVDEEHDMPKKGLALFIGEENTVSNDGLTPEQVKKREKFLRNRQQKIEEDKMKKDALLEKKRRKEEKMREIQLRREQEEKSRHDRLQEKQKQAEHAKRERQQYEMRRKENLRRTNFIDESLGVDTAYATTGLDIQSIDKAPGGHGGCTWIPTSRGDSFQIPSPVQTTIPAAFSGFTGVQSYVKPSGKTNRKLIINAISHVCLPGAVNKDTKEKCLQAMTESSAQHFLILFKEGLKFRALYSLALESNQVLKVHGIGPRSVTEKMIDQLYKYNSGGKEFTKIPAKGFSLSVDGFTLQKSCWQSNKPPVPSKTSSNFKQATYRSTR